MHTFFLFLAMFTFFSISVITHNTCCLIHSLELNVERLPPSPHVKEPRVTAHYEHYAHEEWSIRDLLHWQNYPSIPITFPCFESRGV